MRLILASSSPYRRTMLERLGLPFTSISPDIDETPMHRETPDQLAQRLSVAKAQAVARHHPDAIVIGSDQVAALGLQPLGKPGNLANARHQLQQLSGQTVLFHSGLCVLARQQQWVRTVVTECTFRHLNNDEIDFYLQHDQPFDTAGSAKAESLGIALMENMHSDDPTAIIGLPLIALTTMLRQAGLNPLASNTLEP
jgi:septum formation protein